jgi:hypothetical protein
MDSDNDNIFLTFDTIHDFWYLGKTILHPNYESCLILVRDIGNTICINSSSLFLLNIKGKQLLSIARIADYFNLGGDGSYEYLKLVILKSFSFSIITYDEAIVLDKKGNIINSRDYKRMCGTYKFNKHGYVIRK